MKKPCMFLVLIGLVSVIFVMCGQNNENIQTQVQNYKPIEHVQIIKYLLDDWDIPMHSTNIDLAMKNLNIEPDNVLRLQVGQYLRENVDIADNLKFWGANNYILNNEEKRIAKFIINAFNSENRMPLLTEAAEELKIPAEELKTRLTYMANAGLLVASGNENLGYGLADGYELWGGPLKYNFHTITVENEKSFDVW